MGLYDVAVIDVADDGRDKGDVCWLGIYVLAADVATDVAYEAPGNGGADNMGGCPFAKGGGGINEAMKSCMLLGMATAAFDGSELSRRLGSAKEARSSSAVLLLRR